jgi:chromosome partitioning protein
MVISVINQKGGAGKTTIATNIAVGIAKRGAKVILVDTDKQGSAMDWHSSCENPLVTVVGMDRPKSLAAGIASLAESYQVVVIDGAPSVDDMAIESIKISDLVLIPVQPSPYDIWAASTVVEMVKARRSLTNKPEAAFIISRAIPNTILGREISDALSGYELPVLNGTMQRQIYAKAAATGQSIYDFQDVHAIAEINEILNYIESTI